ncbi:MAG TPA: hypothetical protein VH722_13890 [Alphaproteobacteria bacterium]|jgi:hypothetical protein|nr:hypothetical protein [Alphaproteobacteria bacterium]
MRTKTLAVAALLALAVSPQALAQQTQGQDDQSGAPTRQTTSATWSGSGSAPEQAGDLYQAKTGNDGSFGGGSTTDPQGATLPGALNPGTDSLGNAGQPQPKE